MHVVDEFVDLAVSVNETLRKFFRVRSGIANTLNAIDFRDVFQKGCEVRDFAIRGLTAIGIHVLA